MRAAEHHMSQRPQSTAAREERAKRSAGRLAQSAATAPDRVETERELSRGAQAVANDRVERWLRICAWLLFLAAACCNVWYVFVSFRSLFQSDAAMKVLLAEEMARTWSLFPKTWYFVNDFPTIFPHLFVVVYRLFVSDYLTQHALAVITSVALFSLTIRLIARQLALSPVYALLLQAVLLTGFSEFFAQVLFGEAAYLLLVTATAFVVHACIETHAAASLGKVRTTLAIMAALVALSVAGGVRGILTIAAPVAISTLLFAILETEFFRTPSRLLLKRTVWTIAVIGVAVLPGWAANAYLAHTRHLRLATSAAFAPFEQIAPHVLVLAQGWLTGGGALPPPGAIDDPVRAIRAIAQLPLTLFVTFVPWFLLLRYRRSSSPALRFIVLVSGVTCSTTLYFYLFGTIAVDGPAFRYFAAPFVFSIIISVAFCQDLARRYGHGFTAVCIAVGVWIVAFGCVDLVSPGISVARSLKGDREVSLARHRRLGVVDAARKEHLTFGYATYWNAQVVTALSNGEIRVLPVWLWGAAGIMPVRYLESQRWYEPEMHGGRIFIFLGSEELHSRRMIEDAAGPPDKEVPVRDGLLLVYGTNFAVQREIVAPIPPADRRARLQVATAGVIATGADGSAVIPVTVTNLGNSVFASAGPFPILVGAHLEDENGNMLNYDLAHAMFPVEVKPGQTRSVRVPVQIAKAGRYVVDLDVLQGAVTWFGTENGKHNLHVTVVRSPEAAGAPVR
jgi:hypothetical protein